LNEKILTSISTFFIIAVIYHISYPSNIAVFGSLALLLLYKIKPIPLKSNMIYIIISFVGLFLFYALLNLTIHTDVNAILFDVSIKKVGLSLVLFIFILVFYFHRKELLIKSINNVLFILVGLWFMQLIVFYATGEYVDLLEPIAGVERAQRYQAYFIQSSLPFEVIRPTSIFIEPGTYGVNTVMLLMLSFISNQNKLTKLHIMTILSFYLSLSLFAIIVATLFIIAIELPRIKLKLNKKNIFLVFILIILVWLISEYLYFRFVTEQNMGAIGLRNQIIDYWLSLGGIDLLLGVGHTTKWAGTQVSDASFLFKIIFEFGIFSIPYFILMIYISWGRPILFLPIMLLTKINYQVYIIWFYFAALFLLNCQVYIVEKVKE